MVATTRSNGARITHLDSTFSNSLEAIDRIFAGMPEPERRRILSDKMLDVYNLREALSAAQVAASAA